MRPEDDREYVEPSIDPPRNFTIATEERVRAMAIGVPAYAERKKRIEDMEVSYVAKLVKAHDAAVARGDDPEPAMQRALATFELTRMNELVKTHNRYYPMEANLPIDPATGHPLLRGVPFRPEEPFTVARLMAAARARLASR